MKTKTFCFDLDNTLCDTVNSQYEKSKPKKNAIKTELLLSGRSKTLESMGFTLAE